MKINITIKQSILFFFGFVIIVLFAIEPYHNYKHKELFDNHLLTIGYYEKKLSGGKSTPSAFYIFYQDNEYYKGNTSLPTFKNSNPIVGKYYIVAYNSKNPNENICFLNLEVNDSLKRYFKKGSINKIPIESYQRTIDSFFLESLTGGISKYFPPYYTKEDFPELEYLWKEE